MKLHSLWIAALALPLALGCSDDRPGGLFTQDVPVATDMDEPSDGPCSLPNILCGRRCVSPADDPANCGGCGLSCGSGRVCVNGRCDNQCPETPSRQTRCNDRCTDTNVDRSNCGGCGAACPDGQVCSGGTCQIECGPQYTSCTVTAPDGGVDGGRADASTGPSVRCADLRADDQNCGACGNACPLGHACVDGACELRCPRGQTVCDGRCVDLMTSQTDCGACGNACTGLQRCANGSCSGMACPSGTTDCGGTCADLTSSVSHCGMCGNACPAPQFCRASRCVLECPTGRTACENRCVDVQTDRTHCGMCGNVCPAGQVCTMGACQLVCPMGTIACMGRCVDPSTDRLNCGRCGNACGDGQLCNGGSCAPRCADVQTNCSGVCVNTAVDPVNCGACGVTCGAGYACAGGFCRPLVGTDVAGCAPPSVQCGAVCADIRNDNENCGRCGTRCTADRLCILGACVAPCEVGQTRCGAACVNTLGDRANCGRCGNACAATLSCVAGVCSTEPTFRVDELNTTMAMCRTIDHDTLSGDDRGGIAVSASRVFYTGDTSTVHAALSDLSGLAAVTGTPAIHDGLLSDLASNEVYVLLNAAGAEPTGTFLSTPFTATQLGVINGTTGALTATRIRLSTAISMQNAGIFSGRGRAYIHTGSLTSPPAGAMTNTWYQIALPSGAVTVLRAGVTAPTHSSCENWAYWGVAEFFDSDASAVYVESSTRIVRYRIRDGMITPLATVTGSLSDMCSFTVSPSQSRWYFHYEGSGFAGGTFETLGSCPARTSTP
ncbi:MAG: MXAN_6577-like cysteine-rich protein [Polyangiales bacterium]